MRSLLVKIVPLVLIAAAWPAPAPAAESTITYPVGAAPCGGTIPACEPAQDFTVTTDGVLRAEVEVSFTCIATTVYFSVDGTAAAPSAAVPVGASTGVVDLGPVVRASSVAIPCDASGDPADAVEEYAAGASGLQNLGDGNYQLNWGTLRSYAGTCRRVRLDLGERDPDGTVFYRTADFKFSR